MRMVIWLVFRQDGFRKSYPMFAIKKMQFYPVLSITTEPLEISNRGRGIQILRNLVISDIMSHVYRRP